MPPMPSATVNLVMHPGGASMIGSNLKLALLEHIESKTEPMLSLYLNVNPAHPDNTMGAFVLRGAEAMRQAGIDKDYIDRITDKLSADYTRPEGRTLALYAGEDPDEQFDAYFLQTSLPFLEADAGAVAHWGRALVAPLLFVLDQRERYGVVYVASRSEERRVG